MEEQKNINKKRRWGFWHIFDGCLFALCVLLFLFQWDPIGIVSYLTGYFGGSIWTSMDISIFLCWPVYVFLLITGIIRMVKWQGSFQSRWKLLLKTFLFIFLIILCFPFIAFMIPTHKPPLTYIMGFQKWTATRLDVEEVRKWMRNIDEKAFVENQPVPIRPILNEVSEKEFFMPESILKLYPLLEVAHLGIDSQGDKFLKIWSGSGHGHWEVVIYLSSHGVTLPDPEREYRTWLRLDNGSYVRIY